MGTFGGGGGGMTTACLIAVYCKNAVKMETQQIAERTEYSEYN